ncbi:src like adaptor 1a isoform X1 [Vanacampus margaritifer]
MSLRFPITAHAVLRSRRKLRRQTRRADFRMGNAMRGSSTRNNLDGGDHGSSGKGSEDTAVVLADYPSPDVSEPIFRIGQKLGIVAQYANTFAVLQTSIEATWDSDSPFVCGVRRQAYWWKVRSLQTGKENYIPGMHVAKVYHGWLLEGVTRQKAEELLLLPGNRLGSFLVRESSTERGMYVLSVRHSMIRHYRIRRLDNGWYYISPGLTFRCLEDLINHYYDFADGLCCTLTSPRQSDPTAPPTDVAPVVMRRHADRTKKDGTQLSGTSHRDDNMLSYGVRNSIAAYLSFSECDEAQSVRRRSRQKKSKSIYVIPENGLANIGDGDL